MTGKKLLGSFVAAVALTLGLAATAFAYTPAAGYAVSDFATDFPSDGNVGPVGLAFDARSNLFVMDYHNGILYKFGTAGGKATAQGVQISTTAIQGAPAGIAFAKDGKLYAALQSFGQVIEIDPSTGEKKRLVTDGTPGATGIATDPLSGDLFVSNPFGGQIYRLTNFSSGSATVSTYATPGGPDGITFGADGTMYVASGGYAKKISGTNKAGTPTVTTVAQVPTIDGIALAAGTDPANPKAIFGNRNDGKITKVDLTTPGAPVETDIVTGGTRGDFSQVGPDGCLYATQSATVAKVTNADGTCSFAPTVSVPVLRLTPATQTASAGTQVTITATLTNASPEAGHTVTFTVTGANPKVGTATTNASGVATFTYSGSHTGDDSVTAATTANDQAVTSNTVRVTWTAAAATPSPLPPALPQTGGGRSPNVAAIPIGVALLLLAWASWLLWPRRRRSTC